ncbi:Glyoxalase/bleomycin resistance protein/dioxygenase [candidate division TM7 genomosp. GTL1]|nr:Glyoxalase/bleomycin resistance protein/dioxygenase [candidate division TM7 genomosp. GTL1]
MFKPISSLSSFSVNDLARAKQFYAETLGLQVTDQAPGIQLHLPGGSKAFVYPKDDHEPANYTNLDFVVEDIDEAIDELERRGVIFEHYEGMPQDDKGVLRGNKLKKIPDTAWFKDPAGNVFAVLQYA